MIRDERATIGGTECFLPLSVSTQSYCAYPIYARKKSAPIICIIPAHAAMSQAFLFVYTCICIGLSGGGARCKVHLNQLRLKGAGIVVNQRHCERSRDVAVWAYSYSTRS